MDRDKLVRILGEMDYVGRMAERCGYGGTGELWVRLVRERVEKRAKDLVSGLSEEELNSFAEYVNGKYSTCKK
jgi:hypothetical protein